ncbi:MAG TPA: DUF5615 family PIN-like protein [Thermomicrobiales bacterium]|nr:DUF5615 family PIN-like protein [Thermomicrobiales bacterium]
MSLRYLCDENVDAALTSALRRRDPDLATWVVGDPGTPPRGTLDPDILLWCEEHDFVLVTNNRRTMPIHLAEHLGNGHHSPGIFLLNPGIGVGETTELLLLAARASDRDEYRDQIKHLPIL